LLPTFLYIDTISACLNSLGKQFLSTNKLNIHDKGTDIDFGLDFNNSTLILSEPGAILFLRELILSIISSGVIDSKNIDLTE